MKSNRNQQQQKKKVGNRKAGSRIPKNRMTQSHPPPVTAQSVRSIVVRTLSTAVLNQTTLTFDLLSQILGLFATSATTSVFWALVFRLDEICIWGPVAAAGTPVAVSLTWNNTSQDFEGPPITTLDTSISFDWPACICQKPPTGSLSSKWHGSDQNDICLTLSAPSGSTVDFHFSFVLNDAADPLAGPTLVGATPFQMGHAITSNLTPQAVNAFVT